MGSRNKGRQQEDTYRQQADAAAARARSAAEPVKEPDELEKRRRDYLLKFDKWRMGESGPIDVRNMPGGELGLSLFNDAKKSRDEGRVGRGLASLEGGANPAFATALDKETQLERDTNASGMLENYVAGANANADEQMGEYAQMGNARTLNYANLERGLSQDAYGNYYNYLNRPQKPSFLKQLALGLLGGVSSFAGSPGGSAKIAAMI